VADSLISFEKNLFATKTPRLEGILRTHNNLVNPGNYLSGFRITSEF